MEERAELALARANVYRFLGRLYSDPPRLESLYFLAGEEGRTYLLEVFGEEARTLIAYLARFSGSEQELQRLRVEFDGLFRVPGPYYATPYESVYCDGQRGGKGLLWGPSTQAVIRFYRRVGLAPVEAAREVPDHVALELKLMHLLAAREADNWRAGDEEAAQHNWSLQEEFLSDHLLRWIEPFCEVLAQRADSDFYRGVAAITRGFLAGEALALTPA